MKTIPEYKFSEIEACENGIRIGIITPTGDPRIVSKKNVYISNDGINTILSRFFELNQQTQTENNNTDELSTNDEIEDAVY